MTMIPGNPEIENSEYKRELGLFASVSIVIGKIIGSGIFRTPGPIMALALSTSLFGLVWLLAGVITILCAMIYAELVAMLPKSGGPYVFLKEAYHPVWAFLRGWAMFFVSETGSIAVVALVFAEYLNALWAVFFGEYFSKFYVVAIALAAIWILTVVNFFGVYVSGIIQSVFSSAKIIAIGGIIGAAFASSKGNFHNFTTDFWPKEFTWETFLALGAAMRLAFFTFSGWEGSTYVAEEVKNPKKNLPLSLFLGITGVIILYAGANIAYIYILPVEVMKGSTLVAYDAMKTALGGAGGIFISAAVMLNTFGNVSTQIFCKARTWQAMSRDGLFFKSLEKLSPKFKTPNNALIAQAAWASVLLIFASSAKNSYEAIIDFFSANGTIWNIMTFYSIHLLRKKYPDMERPYKAWLYPYSLIIVIFVYVIYLAVSLITAFKASMTGILLTSTGLLYYWFFIHKKKQG